MGWAGACRPGVGGAGVGEGPGVGWEGPRRRGVGGAAGENSLSTSLRNCVATASSITKSSSLSESVPHPGGATRRSLFITASCVASSLSCCYV